MSGIKRLSGNPLRYLTSDKAKITFLLFLYTNSMLLDIPTSVLVSEPDPSCGGGGLGLGLGLGLGFRDYLCIMLLYTHLVG